MRRLLLFDIDGTLLSTNGAAKRAFHRALLAVYGSAGPIATHPFDGKTDPQIARELLEAAGFARGVIDRGFEALWKCYLRELAVELARPGHVTTLLPGVRPLLAALGQRSDSVLQGLLTGNIEQGAGLKLRSVGLDGHFRTGAYGSDHERRDQLAAIAIERATALTGRTYTGRDVVIIGDTPFDMTCGAALGVRAVGVATGRYGANELRAAGAAAVLDDLSDTTSALDALLGD
ncbi:MAG TPA: HAD hydrolase-like protein [Longimicrobiales bacterium]